MRENRYFIVPVNILNPVCARPGFFGRTKHNTQLLRFVLTQYSDQH